MQGQILMTHPTKAIYGTLLKDFVKLGRGSTAEEQLFSEEDLQNSLKQIDVVDFHQTVEYNGIKVRIISLHFQRTLDYERRLRIHFWTLINWTAMPESKDYGRRFRISSWTLISWTAMPESNSLHTPLTHDSQGSYYFPVMLFLK